MRKISGSQAAAAAAIVLSLAAGGAHAASVYSNDFETNSLTGFSGTGAGIVTAPNGSTNFLGQLGQGNSTTLTLNTQGFTSLTLNYDLYALNTLDGEGRQGGNTPSNQDAFIVTIGGVATPISNFSFANFPDDTQSYPVAGSADQTGAIAVNTLGYGAGNDATYHFTYTFAPTGASTTITFTGATNQSFGDEGYGLDNVNVTGDPAVVTAGGVPEPMTWALMLTGFGGMGALLRRRRAVVAA